jgi:predicted transcriptional regulator
MNENIIGKRRSRIEIIADILMHSQNPAKKTHIMYRCSLSFGQLKSYLRLLRLKALIQRRENSGTVTYQITEKGQTFLRKYISVLRLLQP